MRHFRLDRATRFDSTELTKKERKKLAPKEEGLNIEGLCASADGRTIYIGFRNPRPVDRVTGHTKALVLPLNNPKQVIEDCEAPIFGQPMSWDLAGPLSKVCTANHQRKGGRCPPYPTSQKRTPG